MKLYTILSILFQFILNIKNVLIKIYAAKKNLLEWKSDLINNNRFFGQNKRVNLEYRKILWFILGVRHETIIQIKYDSMSKK